MKSSLFKKLSEDIPHELVIKVCQSLVDSSNQLCANAGSYEKNGGPEYWHDTAVLNRLLDVENVVHSLRYYVSLAKAGTYKDIFRLVFYKGGGDEVARDVPCYL